MLTGEMMNPFNLYGRFRRLLMASFCLMLIGVGLVVCGLVAEFFADRKENIRHNELINERRSRRAPQVEGLE